MSPLKSCVLPSVEGRCCVQLNWRSGELCSPSLKAGRPRKTFGFHLQGRAVCPSPFPSSLLIVYSVIYLHPYGLRHIYFVPWVTFWRCLLACSNCLGFVPWELRQPPCRFDLLRHCVWGFYCYYLVLST